MGYRDAGFLVVGVDRDPQPRYVGHAFYQADALEFVLAYGHLFDAVHASPPCQAYSSMQRLNSRSRVERPDLVAQTRQALASTCKPYVIENVEGAPLLSPSRLCGSMFGLKVRRHRGFETHPFSVPQQPCRHPRGIRAVGVYGDHPQRHTRAGDPRRAINVTEAREAMGIKWMEWKELTEAVPPAYTRYIGAHLKKHLGF
jgi:DNA (cytosine-5)-methyltransferase 1